MPADPLMFPTLRLDDLKDGVRDWLSAVIIHAPFRSGDGSSRPSHGLDATVLVRASLAEDRARDLPTAMACFTDRWIDDFLAAAPADVVAASLRVDRATRTYASVSTYITNYETLLERLFLDNLEQPDPALLGAAEFELCVLFGDLSPQNVVLDRGLAYLTAIARTRHRDAEILEYVDRVRTDETATASLNVDIEPDATAPPPGEASDLLSRLPDSVRRALPRETRAGPTAATRALRADDDDPAPAGGHRTHATAGCA